MTLLIHPENTMNLKILVKLHSQAAWCLCRLLYFRQPVPSVTNVKPRDGRGKQLQKLSGLKFLLSFSIFLTCRCHWFFTLVTELEINYFVLSKNKSVCLSLTLLLPFSLNLSVDSAENSTWEHGWIWQGYIYWERTSAAPQNLVSSVWNCRMMPVSLYYSSGPVLIALLITNQASCLLLF